MAGDGTSCLDRISKRLFFFAPSQVKTSKPAVTSRSKSLGQSQSQPVHPLLPATRDQKSHRTYEGRYPTRNGRYVQLRTCTVDVFKSASSRCVPLLAFVRSTAQSSVHHTRYVCLSAHAQRPATDISRLVRSKLTLSSILSRPSRAVARNPPSLYIYLPYRTGDTRYTGTWLSLQESSQYHLCHLEEQFPYTAMS